MRVMVTFRHVNSSVGLRSYAEDKVGRLEKFARVAVAAHVILAVEKQRHRAEIQMTGKNLKVTATEETGDLYSAIDLAVDKVERQLKKRAAKQKERKGGDSLTTPVAKPERTTRRDGIRTQRMSVKPMSVGEAVMQLKLGKTDFLLFKNAATDILSVLYRRKDGNFGLVEPEPS
jgi:putative sigma-54 modulation protein